MIERLKRFKHNCVVRIISDILLVCLISSLFNITIFAAEETGYANTVELSSPSAILIEASTGKVIFEKNPDEVRSPASITKIMTLLLTFEAIEKGKIHLTDEVSTSAYAKSMGGSQVFLEEGEIQTVETLIKCIVIASGNDASVAMAEYIAGTESEFVNIMNAKAKELDMNNTHFLDCCGLTSDINHHTTARDVSIMSRELITKYPQIFEYSKIWMEDIEHNTRQGTKKFTLSSTNKLLKQYSWTTGLKTGSTSIAKYCISATARKNDIDLIAVIMGAPEVKTRFKEARELLEYGFAKAKLYEDSNINNIGQVAVENGKKDSLDVYVSENFKYLDLENIDFSRITKNIAYEKIQAPVKQGDVVGKIEYEYEGKKLGEISILAKNDIEKAYFIDCINKIYHIYLLN